MGSELTGDFSKLNRLIQVCGDTDGHKLALAADMAEWMNKRIAQSFWQHRDPNGQAWAPRKQPDRRTNPLLFDTGAYMTGFVDSISTDGITIRNDVSYARFLNDGTVNMPARASLPSDGQLGEWLEPLIKIALTTLTRRLGDK